eukprot:TRINITY_DN16794_c0_g1_i1.p1 TRINITY_DN16794_c0_g1~~TRINITY_DN16794_c0_g1_i1.p1  ORF type:complete len:187 (+),score=29.14 TRINITY_DN16794_c0_g1_i1:299-859(+)
MSSPGTIKDGSGAGGVHFSSSSVHLQHQQQTDNAAVVVSTLPKAAIPITPSLTTSRKSTPASGLDIAAPHQHHNGLESEHAMATYPPHPPTAISITMEHIPSPEPATHNRLPMGRSTPPSILVGGKHSTATSPTPNASIISGDHNLSLIHISEPTRLLSISYAVFCLKKKKKKLHIKKIIKYVTKI